MESEQIENKQNKINFNDIVDTSKIDFMVKDKSKIYAVVSIECLNKNNLTKLNKKEFDFRYLKDKDMLIKLVEFATELKIKHKYSFNSELMLNVIKNLSKISLFSLRFDVYYFNNTEPLFFVETNSYGDHDSDVNVIVLAPRFTEEG